MGVQLGSAYGKIEIDASGVRGGIGDARKELRGFQDSLKQVGTALTVTGGILTGLAVKTTLTAARTEELGIVLRNVAKNAGVSMDAIRDQEETIKDLGITTQVADTLLIKMMQNNLDLSRATDLARLAQDAAVISMEDSSQALDGILHGILTLQPEVLRHRGLMVNLEQEYAKWAATNDRTVMSLTNTEKQVIAFDAALASGVNIAGTYEAAMETAGKQMRSMRRHVEEAANEFGEHLLPVMGAVVEAGTNMLKWLRDLPEPVKATVAQVGALTGGLATVGGAAIVAVPKIMALGAALGTTGAAIMGPAGLLVGIIALDTYLKNLEKAHMAEAAAILESSTSYTDYVRQLEDAGLKSHELTEELYDQAKASAEAAEAFDWLAYQKAAEAVEELGSAIAETYKRELPWFTGETERAAAAMEDFLGGIEADVAGMTDLELKVAANREALEEHFLAQGLTIEQAKELARVLSELAEAERTQRWETEILTRAMEKTSETYTILDEELTKNRILLKGSGDQAQDTADDMEALEEAVQAVRDRYEGFYGTLAQGIVSFREMGKESAESTEEYEESLEALEEKAENVYRDVKMNFQASLPDATSIRDRMSMAEDAWDEWGLRIQDIIESGVASPWYQVLQDMGYAKPPDQGVREWAADMKAAFYEGDLEELINQNAQAWVENAATQKEAQAEATAAYQAEVGKRKAAVQEEIDALTAAREEQLKAEQEARNRATIELALSLAEQTGMLQEWSEQRFGPDFSQVADTADEVLGLLDSGMLEIDGSLQTLLENTTAGIQTALETTGSAAEENKAILDGIATTDWAQEKREQMASAIDPDTMPFDEIQRRWASMSGEMETAVPQDPFAPVMTSFEGATASIITAAGEMDEEVQAAFGNIQAESSSVAAAVIDEWTGNSVFPDLVAGGLDMQRRVTANFKLMRYNGVNAARDLEEGWVDGMKEVRKAVVKVLEELKKIPREIVVKVTTEVDPTDGREYGGPVRAGTPYVVGEAGPEVFVPGQSGTVLPNPVVQALMRLANNLGTRTDNRGYQPGVNIFGGLTLTEVQDAASLLGQLAEMG